MADIFGTYRLLWDDPGAGSFGMYTTDNFPQGTNVYVSTAISNSRANDNAVAQGRGLTGHAFIYQWSVYGADGQINPVDSPANPFLNAIFIDNCANITFAAFAGGGYCGTQVTVFRR
jgi:hypothetical protein